MNMLKGAHHILRPLPQMMVLLILLAIFYLIYKRQANVRNVIITILAIYTTLCFLFLILIVVFYDTRIVNVLSPYVCVGG